MHAQVLAIPVSEELTLAVVVGEMDESIAIDDINGIVTASVKHKIIYNNCAECMYAHTRTGE